MPPKHPHHQQQQYNSGTSYGGGGGGDDGGFDFSTIERFAHDHAGGSGDSGMFGQAMSMISGRQSSLQNEGVNESSMVNAHQSFFGGGDPSGATSGGIGQAAAMQALKMFTGGSGGGSSSGGGNMKQEFMGMAMGQAAKLYGAFCVPLLTFRGPNANWIHRSPECTRKCRIGLEAECHSRGGRASIEDVHVLRDGRRL